MPDSRAVSWLAGSLLASLFLTLLAKAGLKVSVPVSGAFSLFADREAHVLLPHHPASSIRFFMMYSSLSGVFLPM